MRLISFKRSELEINITIYTKDYRKERQFPGWYILENIGLGSGFNFSLSNIYGIFFNLGSERRDKGVLNRSKLWVLF